MKYKKNDVVLVESFAGPNVKVRLLKRVAPEKNQWGAIGWEAVIVYKKDVERLIKCGVPYAKDSKPEVWVFDWQIIEKKRPKR